MAQLTKLKNEVEIFGRVKDINLEETTNRKGVDCIKGSVTILVRESKEKVHDITVDVYSNKFKKDGTENGLFKGYKTVKDTFVSVKDSGSEKEATFVKVSGEIQHREFITEQGKHVKYNNVRAKFFNHIEPENIKNEVGKKGPRAVAVVETVIQTIKDKLDSDGLPSGDLVVNGFTVDFFGNEPNPNYSPVTPLFDLVVKESIADAFQGMYEEKDTAKLTLKINNYAEDAEEDEEEEVETGFGEQEDFGSVKKTFVNNVEIIGGAPAMVNGKEYDEEQIALVDKIRKEELASLEDGYVPSTTSEANVGFGTNETTKKESLSDDDLDVEDVDFDF